MTLSNGDQRGPPAPPEGVDAICDVFEAAWLAGQEPRIEDFLPGGEPVHQDVLLRELLLAEWDLRRRHEQHVELPTYLQRFAESGQFVAELWHVWHVKQSEGLGDGMATALHTAPAEGLGTVIGRYKLLEKLGEGGFGTVWVAEQREPVKRRVAVKVIKLGMDTRQVIARFEAERQALALMDHPNIAKVLDAGATETGGPYFVMELVRGIPITKYCEEERLATQHRLDLFMKVCNAIQHAHQKGIIHRDIKPSNILVTLHDGVPVPKVIDFGIAKAIQRELTEKTIYTQLAQFIGTPAYMSPEQAEMSGLDIDTRSDIYSLGVLLYELLTGATPFDAKELMSSGLDEMRKIIREREPLKPSSRLTKDLETANRSDSQHTALPGTLRVPHSAIDRDLDWIVMKCLEKDRTRRYETANSLALDLKRHLDNEPVVACPPSAAYRFQKAWRRNRLAYTAGLAVSAALILGLGVSLWQTGEANRSRRVAEDASKRAEAEEAKGGRRLYTANMNLAFKAVKENRLGRAAELLSLSRPALGEADPRGWEWRYLWQAIQGDELLSLQAHDYGVHTLAYSPDLDRRILASGGWRDKTVRLWNTRNYQEPPTILPHQASVESLAFNSTGEWLAVLTAKRSFDDGESQVSLWRMEEDPQLFHRFAVKADSDNWWRRAVVTFTPDDSLLVVGQVNGEILLYDYKNKAEVTSFQAHPRGTAINALAFSQDNRWLATGGKDQIVKLWQWTGTPAHPRLEREFLVHNGRDEAAIFSLQFDPTARWLVAGGVRLEGSDLKVWDVQTGEPAGDFGSGFGFIAKGLAFSPDGRYLITAAGDQWLRFWDTSNWTEKARLRGHKSPIWSLAISPDGERLATGGEDQLIKIWDADRRGRTGDATKTLSGLSRVVFSRDSASFLTIETVVDTHHWRVFRSDDLAEIKELKIRELDAIREDVLKEMNIDLAGDTLVTADSSGDISVWDVPSSERITTLPSVLPAVEPLSGRRDFRGALVLSPNGDRLAFQSNESESRVIRVLNIPSGEELAPLRFERPQWPVAFSPDGQRLMACEPGGLVLWDLRTFKPSRGPSPPVWAWVAFSRDGRKVATADLDGFVTLLQVTESGLKPQHQMNPDLYGLFGPCFSPNGDRLAVVSGSGIVWLCDPRTGQEQEVATLEYATARGSQAWFSPNGNNLFVFSNQTLQVYEAPPFSEIERADASQKPQRIAREGDEGAIKQWLILAPIAFASGQSGEDAVDTEQIEGEGRLRPKAGEGTGELKWQEVAQEDYVIDFSAIVRGRTQLSVAYAVCYIQSEVEQRGLQMLVGSDDAAKVYLNGKLIHRYPVGRAFVADQDTVPDIALNAGLNVLVFKVVNEFEDWKGSIRFTDAQGNPVKGITVTLEPDAKDST